MFVACLTLLVNNSVCSFSVPPCNVKVAMSDPGEREVRLSKASSFHPRSIDGKPVAHNSTSTHQGYCPKRDPAAWGIGEKQGNVIGHCDRDSSSYESKSQVRVFSPDFCFSKWNNCCNLFFFL